MVRALGIIGFIVGMLWLVGCQAKPIDPKMIQQAHEQFETGNSGEASENVESSGNIDLTNLEESICFLPTGIIGILFLMSGIKRGIFIIQIGGWIVFILSGVSFLYFLVPV